MSKKLKTNSEDVKRVRKVLSDSLFESVRKRISYESVFSMWVYEFKFWRVAGTGTCVPEAGSHDDGGVVVLFVVVVDPSHGQNPGVLVGLVVLPCTIT